MKFLYLTHSHHDLRKEICFVVLKIKSKPRKIGCLVQSHKETKWRKDRAQIRSSISKSMALFNTPVNVGSNGIKETGEEV